MGKFIQISRKLSNEVRSLRRVVITGMGIISPLGCGVKNAWKALLEGKCGIVKLEEPDYEKLPCKIGENQAESKHCRLKLNIFYFSCII